MPSEMINKIIEKAVMPELQRRFHDTIGVVDSYNPDTKKATVLAHNNYNGGTMRLYNVEVDDQDKGSHLKPDPKHRDVVKIGFTSGDVQSAVIRKVLTEDDVEDLVSINVPSIYGYIG